MRIQVYRLWPRRPRDGSVPLGLSCDDTGLSLGGACRLVSAGAERAGHSSYRARPLADINALLSVGYGATIDASDIYPMLNRIAEYLSRGDLALAKITALHLRFPDLPSEAATRKLAATDALLRIWDSGKHPRWPAHSAEGRGGQFKPVGGHELWVPVSDEDNGAAPNSDGALPTDRKPTQTQLNRFTRAQSALARRRVMGGIWTRGQAIQAYMDRTGLTDEAGGWLGRVFARFLSRFDDPKTLEELEAQVSRSDALSIGYEKHHIVEEGPNKGNIPDTLLQGKDNIVSIPYYVHRDISDFYSTTNPEYGGKTPREYLRGKSFEEQYQFGIALLRRFGALK